MADAEVEGGAPMADAEVEGLEQTRLVWSHEPDARRPLELDKLKKRTGATEAEGSIPARPLCHSTLNVAFQPLLVSNDLPPGDADDVD